MEVTFLRDHITWKAGQTTDVSEELAAYWIRVGLVTPADVPDDEAIEKSLEKKLISTQTRSHKKKK